MENVFKRRDIKVLSSWESVGHRKGAEKYVSSGYMKSFTIFDEQCVAIEMKQKKVKLLKPMQIGNL